MKLLTKANEAKLPKLYTQDEVADPEIIVKYFLPGTGWSWYVLEGERDEQGILTFFGYVDNPSNPMGLELGYFTLQELESVRGWGNLPIERDRHFNGMHVSDIKKEKGEL